MLQWNLRIIYRPIAIVLALAFSPAMSDPGTQERSASSFSKATSSTTNPCVGVPVSGGGSALQTAVRSQPANTTFCVEPGTYSVDAQGLAMQAGDTIDGAGSANPGRPGGTRPTVHIKGAGTVVLYGPRESNVTIQDVGVTDQATTSTCSTAVACGQMVHPGPSWLIRRSWLHDADSQCIGAPGPALSVVNTEISGCGTRWNGPKINGFSAGIKANVGYTVTGSYVHDNNQGIWCDRDCVDTVQSFIVTNTIATDNCSYGIHYENTYHLASTGASAVITDNVARGNNWCGLWKKADIGIVSAENATVTRNQLGATAAHPAQGLGIRAFDRGRGPATGSATGNFLNGDTIVCVSPFVCSNNT